MRDDRRRHAVGFGAAERFGLDRHVAAGDQDGAEGDRWAGCVGGEGRLLHQGLDLALLIGRSIVVDCVDLGTGLQGGFNLPVRQATQRSKLLHDLEVGVEPAERCVLQRLIIVAHDRGELTRVRDHLKREVVVRPTFRECDGAVVGDRHRFLIVDAGGHHAVQRDRAAAVVNGVVGVVIGLIGAERFEIRIVVGAIADGSDGAAGRPEEDVVGPEHLRTGPEGQAGVIVGIRVASVGRGDRNERLIVDRCRGARLDDARVAAVAALAGVDRDDPPGFELRRADRHCLVGGQLRVGARAGAGDQTVQVRVGTVAGSHARRRADVDVSGAEQLDVVGDGDADVGGRTQVGLRAAAGEQARRREVHRVVRAQRIISLDVDLGGRRQRIVVEAEDRPGVDLGGHVLRHGRAAEGRGASGDAARTTPRTTARLENGVVRHDVHIAAGGIDDEARADLGGDRRGHGVRRSPAAGSDRRSLVGVALGGKCRAVIGEDAERPDVECVAGAPAFERRGGRGACARRRFGSRAREDAAGSGDGTRDVGVVAGGGDRQRAGIGRARARSRPEIGGRRRGRRGLRDRIAGADVADGDTGPFGALVAVVFRADRHIGGGKPQIVSAIGRDHRTVGRGHVGRLPSDEQAAACADRIGVGSRRVNRRGRQRGDGQGAR